MTYNDKVFDRNSDWQLDKSNRWRRMYCESHELENIIEPSRHLTNPYRLNNGDNYTTHFQMKPEKEKPGGKEIKKMQYETRTQRSFL